MPCMTATQERCASRQPVVSVVSHRRLPMAPAQAVQSSIALVRVVAAKALLRRRKSVHLL